MGAWGSILVRDADEIYFREFGLYGSEHYIYAEVGTDGNELYITPEENLKPYTQYMIYVRLLAVKDLDGNTPERDEFWSFHTGSEEEISPKKYTLRIGIEGQGTTQPAQGEHEYNEDEEVSLEATADAGWEFEKWMVNGTEYTNPEIAVTMDAEKTATAYFTEVPPGQHTLTVDVQGQGTTVPAAGTHSYDENTEVDLEATPAEGWEFEKWVINGTVVTDPSLQVLMDTDKTATAYFKDIDTGDKSLEELPEMLIIGGKGFTVDYTRDFRVEAGAGIGAALQVDPENLFLWMGGALFNIRSKAYDAPADITWVMENLEGYWDADGEWVDW